jgi:hypothetical protein
LSVHCHAPHCSYLLLKTAHNTPRDLARRASVLGPRNATPLLLPS